MGSLLRLFFHQLYHRFAWAYDAVAGAVSIGRWNVWIRTVVPFVHGPRVLELGHGPGHLQESLLAEPGGRIVGLDESDEMGAIAKRRLRRAGLAAPALLRSLAQHLPFPDGSFDTVVATFPTEFVFEAKTLSEVRRVLDTHGRFVVLPGAWIVGRGLIDRAATWLFLVTHQAPASPADVLGQRLRPPLEHAGFKPTFQTIDVQSSVVLIVIASTSQ
jgi:ubiquinone/menaquinone biosynthesis C-methylase UbiE